jgi:hypothetical protein
VSSVGDATNLSSGPGAYADGGAGDDVITSGKGDDVLAGGTGNDRLEGGDGNDILSAGAGDDILSGGKGADYLAGGAGNDLLEGNDGEDFLFGGKGVDVLRGDQLNADGTINYMARDHFIFEAGDSSTTESTVDIIKDFLTIDQASKLDLDGNGVIGGTGDLQRSDVLYLNWFASDGATAGEVNGIKPLGVVTPANVAFDHTAAAAATQGQDGQAYATFTSDIGNSVADKTSLLDAANAALDKAYSLLSLNSTIGTGNYASEAVQFEYGNKEYVVIDAFVTGAADAATGAAANNYNAANDLLVQIADAPVTWSVNADDIVVTRWDPPVA